MTQTDIDHLRQAVISRASGISNYRTQKWAMLLEAAQTEKHLSEKRIDQFMFFISADTRTLENTVFFGEDIYYPCTTKKRNIDLRQRHKK